MIEIGLIKIIMIAQKINNFHDMTLFNTSNVKEDVIKINTVEIMIDDVFSIK